MVNTWENFLIKIEGESLITCPYFDQTSFEINFPPLAINQIKLNIFLELHSIEFTRAMLKLRTLNQRNNYQL